MSDLLCFGEPMLEFNQRHPDSEGRVLYLEGHGGDSSNAAICAARQGCKVGYITAIGADRAGDSFMALWKTEGVDTIHVKRDPDAPTGIYFVSHDDSGHHFNFYRAGSAASRYAPRDLPEAAIRKAKLFYASGISQAISASAADAVFDAIAIAKAAGVKVAYDTNLRLRLWPKTRARAIIHEAMRHVDYALPSLDDAQVLTGLEGPDAIADFYLNLGCPVVALKLGKQGSLLATREGRVRVPGITVKAVDATGAGDTFCGSFLARIVAGDPPEKAVRYANVAAGLSTTGYGAVAPMPRAEVVLARLKQEGG